MDFNNMTMLYISKLFLGSTDTERKKAFEELGIKIIPFALDPYNRDRSRLELSLTHRLGMGPAIWSLNRDLVKFSKEIDYDIVWIAKGIWIKPETVKALKKSGCKVIHYSPDSHISINRSRHLFKSIQFYDTCITTKEWEIEGYKSLGAKKVVYAHKSVNLDLFIPVKLSEEDMKVYNSDVCFIGRYEPEYCHKVQMAHQIGVDVAVWGTWGKYLITKPWLKNVYRGEGVWHENYVKAICAAKIGLGFLSKKMPERVTQRSFEIPACGTFMLAERTEEHLSYFEEGKEAEFFDSDEELKDKIKYYLKNEEEREKIAAAGRERCVKSGYDNRKQMRRCLEESLE